MKKAIAILCCFVLLFTIAFQPRAHADALTVGLVAGAAAALMVYWGISFTTSNATGEGIGDFFSGKISEYVNTHGGDLGSLFVGELAVDAAGRMIIPSGIYNGIVDFIDWLGESFDLTASDTQLTEGSYEGTFMKDVKQGTIGDSPQNGVGVAFWGYSGSTYSGYERARPYVNNVYTNSTSSQLSNYRFTGSYNLHYSTNSFQIIAYMERINISNGAKTNFDYWTTVATNIHQLDNTVVADGTNFEGPDYINPSEQWVGDVGAIPDTNIEDLIGGLNDDIADNDVFVDGEIVEPGPAPTPVPTIAPDIPLQDVPWEGLNDLIGNTEEGIQEQIQSQTQSITSAQEATTEAVESLTDTLTDALDVPDAEELPDFKFDLRELFPFCIPFDIYRLLSSFDAQPQAPHVQIPIVIESIGFSHNLDLDFSAWNPVAQAMRTAELIVYAIALAWATGKVIKW